MFKLLHVQFPNAIYTELIVPNMTCNVFGGTLNLAQSITQN